MATEEQVSWAPKCFPKQNEIRWQVHPDNPNRTLYTCVSGPRKSSKTVGCLHAAVEHAWEVDRALVAVVSPTLTNAIDGGCWQQLVEEIIPMWIDGGFGLEWVKKPYMAGSTKRVKCSIRNKHGTVSEFQLESFREGADENDIKTRFKGKKLSFIYWSEAATWVKTQAAFDIISECLRLKNFWKRNELAMVIDTNPEAPGEDHWIYQLFYKFRKLDASQLVEMIGDKPIKVEDMIRKQKNYGLIEVFVQDNLSLTEEDLVELKTKYAHSPELWDRYFLGKWTAAAGDGLFYDVFRPATHVQGDLETPLNRDPQMLVPSDDCFELITGWDLGTSNHAFTMMERFYWPNAKGINVPHFSVIDELVMLHSDASIEDFTEAVLVKMDFWESYLGRSLHWTHFSDRSAFDYKESISQRRQHVEVFLASKKRIRLVAVEKGDGSVRQRIEITRRLLFEDRLQFSKTKCPQTIMSVQSIKKGKNTPVDRASEFKHAWDALTYPLQAMCYEELFRAKKAILANRASSQPVSVLL